MTVSWWSRFLDFISPRMCVVCGRRLSPTERSVCTVCMMHLPRTMFQSAPEDNAMVQRFWGLAPIERAAALIFHESHAETAQIVYRLKYGNHPDIGEDMGRLMVNEMRTARFFDGIDVLVPVPLSPKRMRQRGYNQSEMLARGIRELTGIPIANNVLGRKHFRKSQTQLNRTERQKNVEDMFYLKKIAALRGKHVLLIDDVCTTGATLIACASALKTIDGITISALTWGVTHA